jgi:hypothetical protein
MTCKSRSVFNVVRSNSNLEKLEDSIHFDLLLRMSSF